jgi:hypothetical protein
MKHPTTLLFSILISISCISTKGQSGWGIGGSGLYNFNKEYLGISARILIPVQEDLWGVPYVYYYFKPGDFSAGLSGMKIFHKTNSLSFYVIASGTFRGSVSVSVNDSTAAGSKSYKAEGEAGLGVLIGSGCLKLMIEPRYAVISEEVTARLGLVYFFDCSSGKGKKGKSSGGKAKRKKNKSVSGAKKKKSICPAYD